MRFFLQRELLLLYSKTFLKIEAMIFSGKSSEWRISVFSAWSWLFYIIALWPKQNDNVWEFSNLRIITESLLHMTAEGWNNIYENTLKIEDTVSIKRCYYYYYMFWLKSLSFIKSFYGKWKRATCLFLMWYVLWKEKGT